MFKLLGVKAEGVPCEAIKGILKEGAEVMEEFDGAIALDAGRIAAAQAVEHYEIARYGTLKRWAAELGMDDVEELLDATLWEEHATDKGLTVLAESKVNLAAEGKPGPVAKAKAAA